jgi:hypothetical protein
MRDVSASLIADGRVLTRNESRRLLKAAAALHAAFADNPPEEICPPAYRYRLLAPRTVTEDPGPHPLREIILEGWSRFGDVVDADVRDGVDRINDDPTPLVDALMARPVTFNHGDLKLANLGFDGDRVVLVDWGTTSGVTPPAVDFAHYLAINSAIIDATFDETVADIRAAQADAFDAVALCLALLGAFVQLGWEKALGATADDQAVREREIEGLRWWSARAREGLALL